MIAIDTNVFVYALDSDEPQAGLSYDGVTILNPLSELLAEGIVFVAWPSHWFSRSSSVPPGPEEVRAGRLSLLPDGVPAKGEHVFLDELGE